MDDTENLRARVSRCLGGIWDGRSSLLRISSLAGDASTRQYYRAFLASPSFLPDTMIVMSYSDRGLPLSSEELSIFDEPLQELPFVNVHRFLSAIGAQVPDIYADFTDEGLLFLQDLGDRSLWEQVRKASTREVVSWYEKAIEQLLTIQLVGTAHDDPRCIAFRQEFDERLYLWELEHFVEHGLEGVLGTKLDAGLRRALDAHFRLIAEELGQAPKVLAHRDFHSWNLLVHEEKVWVIDFQDALLAPAQYDLASLLNDRDSSNVISAAAKKELIDYYLDRRRELGEAVSDRKKFFRLYLLSAIQRDLKVIGRFHYLENVKGKKGYLRFLPLVIARAQTHLEALDDQRPLLDALRAPFEVLLRKLNV